VTVWFQVTNLLNDCGSCFTVDAFATACQPHGVQHRKTRLHTPKAKRHGGALPRSDAARGTRDYTPQLQRVGDCPARSEIALHGLNAAYNGHRQRVLKGLSPEMVLRPRLEVVPALVNPTYKPSISSLINRALHIVDDIKKVSQSGG